jgi:hypothetical protein
MTSTLPCYEHPTDGCVNRTDIYHPRNKGGWPTIVTLHGRPRTPADMAKLARSLAARGAVVFNIDYRGVRPVSRGYPDAYADVACAIRFARARTARYGGDPSRLILIGHSQGGQVAGVVALAGDRFPGKAGECKVDEGRSLPEGLVHVAGVSINDPSEPINATWFGGTRTAVPERWARGDIYTHMGRNKGLQVGIIFERNDPVLTVDNHALWLQAAFRAHHYRSRLLLLDEGSTHFDILDTDTALGRRLVDFAWSVVRRTDPR